MVQSKESVVIDRLHGTYLGKFSRILSFCDTKFNEKHEQYGDSWLKIGIPEMRYRLRKEIREWYASWGERYEDLSGEDVERQGSDEITEIVDIINVELVLAERINQRLDEREH